MIDIVSKRRWFFIIAILLLVPGLISMIIPPGWSTLQSGLRPGIDFSSGSVLSVTFTEPVTAAEIKDRLTALGHPEALVQATGSSSVIIRTKLLVEAAGGQPAERQRIEDDLSANVAPIQSVSFDSVSPIVAQETVRNAFYALAAASLGIMLYIWYSFRKVPRAYRYGVCAIVTLIHELIFVIGVFSILGRALGMEVNSMFIVGILTVAGYSVNDKIVVFDRIRENALRYPDRPMGNVVNLSIMETLGRSLNTAVTTLLVLLAMLLIGGESIRELLLVLAIGITIGVYGSIFNAAQLLVAWDNGEIGRFFRPGRRAPAAAAAAMLHLLGR